MDMILHRGIRTGADRRPAPQVAARDSADDLAVLYIDRLLGSVKFTPQLLKAVVASLDFPSRLGLGSALLRGKTQEEIATLSEDECDGSNLANQISEGIDSALVEREATRAFEACHTGRDILHPFTIQRERLAVIFGLGGEETEFLCLLQCAFGNEAVDGRRAYVIVQSQFDDSVRRSRRKLTLRQRRLRGCFRNRS